jgi:hypothetical protein
VGAALTLLAATLLPPALVPQSVRSLGAVERPGGDALLMIWNLWHVKDALSGGRNPLRSDLVYHPLGAGLARHTYSPGFAPVPLLAEWIWPGDRHNPIRAYRLSLWLSFSLAFACCHFFLRSLGMGGLVALAPALLYAFSPFVRWNVGHLQHLSAAFLAPLVGLLAVRAWHEPRASRLFVLGFVLGAGVYFGELIVFIGMALGLAVLAAVVLRSTRALLRERLRSVRPAALFAGAAAFLVTIAPFAAQWTSEGGRAPRYEQSVYGSANAAGFVLPDPAMTPLYRHLLGDERARQRGVGGYALFLGFPLLVLAPVGLSARPRGWAPIAGTVTAAFFVLSLGPELKVGSVNTGWPLPYRVLMEIPPLSMGRTPANCALLVVLGVACLAGRGLQWLRGRVVARAGRAWGLMLCVAFAVWAWLEVRAPGSPPPVYRRPAALDGLVPGAVVNVPLSVFDGFAVFMQTFHGRPILTGWVSRRSPEQLAHVRSLQALIDADPAAFVARVRALGAANVVLGPGTRPEMADALLRSPINVVDLRGEASLVAR